MTGEEAEEEVEGGGGDGGVEAGLGGSSGEPVLEVSEVFGEVVAEERDEGGVLGGEEVEVEGLDEGVGGLGGVLEGADAVAAGEGGGRHEGAVEDVALLDLGVVEEDLEGDGVEDGDDSRVRGNEGTRWHVGSDDG